MQHYPGMSHYWQADRHVEAQAGREGEDQADHHGETQAHHHDEALSDCMKIVLMIYNRTALMESGETDHNFQPK